MYSLGLDLGGFNLTPCLKRSVVLQKLSVNFVPKDQ